MNNKVRRKRHLYPVSAFSAFSLPNPTKGIMEPFLKKSSGPLNLLGLVVSFLINSRFYYKRSQISMTFLRATCHSYDRLPDSPPSGSERIGYLSDGTRLYPERGGVASTLSLLTRPSREKSIPEQAGPSTISLLFSKQHLSHFSSLTR